MRIAGEETDLTLKPPRAPYGDDFFQRVAKLYAQEAKHRRDPAKYLAAINELPVSTLHRWVKEARRRGFLPPGRPGKAG